MTRNWVVIATVVGGLGAALVACSSSKDKPAGGSATSGSGGSGGSGSAAGSAGVKEPPVAVSGIPAGPIPVTLPAVKAPHARAVPSAERFIVIDGQGELSFGKLAPGATPYAGEKVDRKAAVEEAFKNLAAPAQGDISPIVASVEEDSVLHGRIADAGPIDILVLADARAPAGLLVNLGPAKDKRMGLAIAGPNGLARLDLLFIDRWAPGSVVKVRLDAKEARVERGDVKAEPIPVNELGAALTKIVAETKGTPPFVELIIDGKLTVDTLVATLGTIVGTGVKELDIRTNELDGVFGDLTGGEPFYAPDEKWEGIGAPPGFAARDRKSNWISIPIDVKLAGEPNDSDRITIKRYLRQRTAQSRTCYQKRLKAKPKLEGKSTANFVVKAGGGAAEKLTVKGLDKEVDACLADAIRQIQFPATLKKASLVVEATFTFSNAADPNNPLARPH